MEKEELLKRIQAKEAEICKIQKRIDKWATRKTDSKAFEKEYSWLCNFEEEKERFHSEWVKECEIEIKHAERTLEDAKATIEKYKNAILVLEDKESTPVVGIIKSFFDNWKSKIISFVDEQMIKYNEICSEIRAVIIELNRNGNSTTTNQRYDYLNKARKNMCSNTWVGIRVEKTEEEFGKYLEKYFQELYFDLVKRISDYTGEIVDIEGLHIGCDGTLNGIVIGKNGKAKVHTIIAGGYNEGEIVNVRCGQCEHYRVLVHKYKD